MYQHIYRQKKCRLGSLDLIENLLSFGTIELKKRREEINLMVLYILGQTETFIR